LKKKTLVIVSFSLIVFIICSCAVFKKPLDNRSNFSKQLIQTEEYIRAENWKNALDSLRKSEQIWKQIKPLLQIDIDHDYVNEMEDRFIVLRGYIETKDKSSALASILSLQNIWKNIDQM
jgi:hypothetical protein